MTVSSSIRRQHDEFDAFGQNEFGADDELDVVTFRLDVRFDDASERAFVGDRDPAIAELGGASDQFFGVRRTVEEAEIALAVQLCVVVRRNSHG